jgi:hypothetical protein
MGRLCFYALPGYKKKDFLFLSSIESICSDSEKAAHAGGTFCRIEKISAFNSPIIACYMGVRLKKARSFILHEDSLKSSLPMAL